MGQDNSNCCNHSKEDTFLQTEMRIYRWRAQTENQRCLPKVTFKRGAVARKQHQFQQFLQETKDREFLNIKEFEEKQSKEDCESDILIFQKYRCTLQQINNFLTPSEAIYTFNTLLQAFKTLSNVFKDIVVNRNSCFVTKDGEVRAWINPNPKCNFIPSGEDEIFPPSKGKELIFKIIAQTQKCSQNNNQNTAFFNFLREALHSTFRQDLFELTQELILQFCAFNRVQTVYCVSQALRKKDLEESQYNRYSTKRIQIIPIKETRPVSSVQRPNIHFKSKSVGCEGSQHVRPIIPVNSLIAANSSFCPTIRKSNHNLAAILKSSNNNTTSTPKSRVKHSQTLEKTEKPKSIKHLQNYSIQKPQPTPAKLALSIPSESKTPSQSFQISLSADPLISENILSENDTNLQFINKQIGKKNQYRASKLSKATSKNIQRKVSILNIFEAQPKNQPKPLHSKTYHEVNSSTSLHFENHPWKTNKTITKLINQCDSLVHSIGTSSEEYSETPYSGALKHMGRDITNIQ